MFNLEIVLLFAITQKGDEVEILKCLGVCPGFLYFPQL